MTKVLFILNNNPIDPLGVMQLIANTEAEIDLLFLPGNSTLLFSKKYDVVGFSTITGTHHFHNDIAGRIKSVYPSTKTIMGGPHPTFFPQEALALSNIDAICIGEGVTAFNKWIHDRFTNNILLKGEVFNGKLDDLADLNVIKSADRHLIYKDKKRAYNRIKDFMGIQGCPYKCSFCFNESWRQLYPCQPAIRLKTPQLYLEEIIECKKKYPIGMISFQEDTFVINHNWFYTFTEALASTLYLPYHCNVRCDLVNESMIRHMKRTKCVAVTFAIENGNPEYRKNFLNRNMTDETIISAARLFKKYNIHLRTQNMVCLPGQGLKGDLQTLRLNARCRPTMAWASLFQPFPNTELAKRAKQLGEWCGNIDEINNSYFDRSSLTIKDRIKRERLQKLFSIACKYKVIRYLIRLLIALPLDNFYRQWHIRFKNKMYNNFYGV